MKAFNTINNVIEQDSEDNTLSLRRLHKIQREKARRLNDEQDTTAMYEPELFEDYDHPVPCDMALKIFAQA